MNIIARIQENPTAFYAALRAAIVVAVSFGLRLTPEQIGGIYLLAEAVQSWLTRQAVTPVASPTLPQGTEVTVTTPAGKPDEQVTV